ncbi:MAG: hypothetical protein IJA35_03860 [Clostridia bacterium]|nr:hypothetical protein [Clostridia bacterium]
MKRCKKCGTVYSSICGECPKCFDPETFVEEEKDECGDTQKRNSWIALIIGIPLFMIVIYALYYVIKTLVISG